MPLYAIRIGDWVEIRSSKTQPRKVVSQVSLKKPSKKLTELKTAIYIGGKVLGTLSWYRFGLMSGIYMSNGEINKVVNEDKIRKALQST